MFSAWDLMSFFCFLAFYRMCHLEKAPSLLFMSEGGRASQRNHHRLLLEFPVSLRLMLLTTFPSMKYTQSQKVLYRFLFVWGTPTRHF